MMGHFFSILRANNQISSNYFTNIKYLKKALNLKKALKKYSDKSTKSHLNYCISMIDETLKAI